MKNIISTGVLAIVLTSSSMAGMSINSFETNMSNYTKTAFTKASTIESELIATNLYKKMGIPGAGSQKSKGEGG
ncbi:MAG: hypothetical protein VX835_04060 [Pseudomonadota bacterium]|nr:hypothetical protein [Pseudomonadota bacterium]